MQRRSVPETSGAAEFSDLDLVDVATGGSADGLRVDTLSVLVTTAPQRPREAVRGRAWWTAAGPETAAALLGGLVFGWAVAAPSLWRDEAATLSVSRRSLSQIAAVLRGTDLVHGGYYLFAHLALGLHDSVTSLRMVSVVAFALTAVVLIRIGRVLGSPAIGITAAALLVASPLASRYAQDARPFALVTLTAAASTYALLRATLGAPRRSRWVVYSGSLVLLGLANVLAVLLVLPHALVLLRTASGARQPGQERQPEQQRQEGQPTAADGPAPRRSAIRGWTLSVTAAGALLAPFAVAAWSQRGQVDWLPRPHGYDLTGVFVQAYQSRVPILLAVLAVVAVLVRSRGLPPGPAGDALAVGAAWAVVAPVTLWAISQVEPLFDLHYLTFCLPGTALLLASLPWALAEPRRPTPQLAGRLPQLGAVGLVVLVAALGLPQQAAYRDPQTGHAEDLRGVAGYLRTHALPGDAVLFDEPNLRVLTQAYRSDLRGLRDLGLARSAVASDTLFGVGVAPAGIPVALAGAPRVWLVRGIPGPQPPPGSTEAAQRDALAAGYTMRSRAQISTFDLALYVRTP